MKGKHRLTVLLAFLLLCLLSPPALGADITLMVLDNNSYLASLATRDLDLGKASLLLVSARELKTGGHELARRINLSRVIVVDVMGRELEEYVENNIEMEGKTVYALRGSTDDERLRALGFVFDPEVSKYYASISRGNIANMLKLVAHRHFDTSVEYGTVVKTPEIGIYHPDAGRVFSSFTEYMAWLSGRPGFRQDAPMMGLLFFSSFLTPGQEKPLEETVRVLEKEGFNVLPCFGRDRETLRKFLLDSEGRPRVRLVLAFTFKFYSALCPELERELDALDVPVINAISIFRDTADEWRKSPVGIAGNEVAWGIATPEMSGLIEPTALSAKKEITAPGTGKRCFVNVGLSENLERLIPRIRKWLALQEKPVAKRRVAIMFYNHSQGKQNVGASYLNVFASLAEIISALGEQGYSVGELPSERRIKELILTSARNVGSWAPGELEKLMRSPEVVRLPIKQYRQWFSQLPEDFRAHVLEQWGRPEDAFIMRDGDDFVIPAVTCGNCVLLPEPARGWSDDPMKLYHDPSIYPHHQYLAVYLWLSKGFRADVMIHLGTHATYEWNPGKQAGLSPSCAPEVLIGDVPNIYPYIVDDVGEGIQAKRRGRAVIVSHLTPMLHQVDLYQEYGRMAELVNQYEQARSRGSITAKEKLNELVSLATETGILADIASELPAGTGNSTGAETVKAIGHYLEEINENLFPRGLHTFGKSPERADALAMAEAVTRWNPEEKVKDVAARIERSGSLEMDSLLLGFKGRYVKPGQGNDPVRNPESLPTGRNFYGFNPNKLPTHAAWNLGKRAAVELVEDYVKKHGKYPSKVAVVLWAVETLRNEGVNESTILYLMGIRPRWSSTGRVIGLEAIPARELGRPRIDVMINASGLYRDLFPDKLEYLDRALQLAIRQTDIENLIAQNSMALEKKLMSQGMSQDEARALSRLRVFSEKPGSYGTGVSEMTGASGLWENEHEVVDVYENRVGYAFGHGRWGVPARNLLRENLASVDVAVHSRSSNVYGLLDNDDMFQYLGGLSMAVRMESGRSPDTVITQQQKPGRVNMEDVAKTLGREIRSRYLNPQWIRGMQQEDYAGAREMSHYFDYLWGWQVTTPDKVDGAKWQQSFDVYVKDKYGLEMKAFFNRANPWAFQSITARMLEAVRKGYWKADDAVQRRLAVEYATSVVEKGVACCDHTCNNPLLNQMVVSIISVPGVMSPDMVEKFRIAIEQAAGKSLDEQVKARRELQARLAAPSESKEKSDSRADASLGSAGQKSASKERPNEAYDYHSDKVVEGYKMEKMDQEDADKTEVTSSGVEWLASLFVLLVVCAMGYGVFRRSGT